jgi:hypothetical protein
MGGNDSPDSMMDALLEQVKVTEPYGFLTKPVQDRELKGT